MSKGREIAARVLARVLSEASWIAPTLDRALHKEKLELREAARATDLVYGTTRLLAAIDAEIDRHRPKKKAIEPFTRAVLATSVFELAGHRDQAHAIVSSAVNLVRRERGEGMARFTNAILRRVSQSRSWRLGKLYDGASTQRVGLTHAGIARHRRLHRGT